DLALVDLADDLVRVDALARDLVGLDTPDPGDVCAVLGVVNVAGAGELVALLAVLASALPVGLSGDRRVPAALATDPTRCKNHVDRAEHILHAMAVVLNAAGVHEETGAGGAPEFCGFL